MSLRDLRKRLADAKLCPIGSVRRVTNPEAKDGGNHLMERLQELPSGDLALIK